MRSFKPYVLSNVPPEIPEGMALPERRGIRTILNTYHTMQTAVQQAQSGNLAIYNQVRSVPSDAITPITGGPMKGKSNINPQWRLEKLTELFGPAGIGWKVEQVARWSETTGHGEVAVFCEVNLYVKQGEQWSAPVFGQGGNMLMRRSTEWVNGQPVTAVHIDDEAYKKAYTDAISVACKALGFAADVYYKEDETKYGAFHQELSAPHAGSQPAPQGTQAWPWTQGFKEIKPMDTPAVLVRNHGPFAWGTDADNAVHNAVVLEEVAKMAFVSMTVHNDFLSAKRNPYLAVPAPTMNKHLIVKHYSRKHGPNAYYGQKKK